MALSSAFGHAQGRPDDLDASPWLISRYTTTDGLPQASIRALAEDADGYLWVGTAGGLARFDGRRFVLFDIANTPTLRSNRILSLLYSSTGDLWIGTTYHGVVRMRDGKFTSFPDAPNAPAGDIRSILEDARGDIWFGGDNLVRCGADGFVEVLPTERIGQVHSMAIRAASPTAELWIATNVGLLRRRASEWESIPAPAGRFRAPDFLGIAQSGQVLVSDTLGTGIVQEGRLHPLPPTEMDPGPLRTVATDAGGRTWFGGRNGVFQLAAKSPTKFHSILDSRPFGQGGVRCILHDSGGNTWIGCQAYGLVQLRPKRFRNIPLVEAGRTRWPVVRTLQESDPYYVLDRWVRELRNDRWIVPEGLVGVDDVQRIAMGEGPRLWLARSNGVLTHYTENGLEDFRHEFGYILRVRQDVHGDVWLYSTSGLVRFDGARFHLVPGTETLRTPLILEASPRGGVWVGMAGRILGFLGKGGTERVEVGIGKGLPDAEVRGLLEDPDGSLWAPTYGAGLVRVRADGRIDHFTTKNGIPDNALGAIVADDRGGLWINSNRGVIRLLRTELEAVASGKWRALAPTLLATGEGNGEAGGRRPDGTIWFPTVSQLVVIDPDRIPHPVGKPHSVTESVVANGTPITGAGCLAVPPGCEELLFGFTAPNFVRPNGTRFRYRLMGYDEEWIEAGTNRYARYTKVPPGEYSFRLMAGLGCGKWREARAVDLRVGAYFHETRWFQALLGGFLFLGIFGLHRFLNQRIRSSRDRLTAEVDERRRAEIALRASEERATRALADQVAAEQRRADLEEQFRHTQKMEAVGQLAAGVAHEFNNLLTGILSNSELVLMSLEDNEAHAEDRESLEDVIRCSDRAATLTKQLLSFAKKDAPRPREFVLNDLLIRNRSMLNRAIHERVSLQLELCDDLPAIRADEGAMENALLNLAINARDAMPEGGTLTFRTTYDPATETVSLHAIDTGTGMTEATKARLFEPFYTTKPPGQGTGLGLSTVFADVRRSGGQIAVTSELGRGTTFQLTFPLAMGETERPLPVISEIQPAADGATVLVCDDEPAVLNATCAVLERAGYTVLRADSPATAIQMAREQLGHIDILVTDVVMPQMNGPELRSHVEELHPDIKVLYMSGYSADLLSETEDFEFLQKPSSGSSLLLRMRRLHADADEPSARPST